MDQRETESSRLFGPQGPSDYLADLLGRLLRAPVRDIPTAEQFQNTVQHMRATDTPVVDDWQSAVQGIRQAGIPTEEDTERQVGRSALDYLTMAHGIASLLKSGTGAAQELMGKRRGQEMFGKEMMDTSRRAQPQWHQKIRDAERDVPLTESTETLGGLGQIMQGRKSYEQMLRQRGAQTGELPPQGTPTFRHGERLPTDVVTRDVGGARLGLPEAYAIGEPVVLPGGRTAQYMVIPRGAGGSVVLDAGDRPSVIFTSTSLGEALAKARQLQNRLALAAKDLGRVEGEFGARTQGRTLEYPERQVRLPWERGTRPFNTEGPEALGRGPLWPYDYQPPPTSGRWSE